MRSGFNHRLRSSINRQLVRDQEERAKAHAKNVSHPSGNLVSSSARPSSEMLAERDAALAAPLSLTAHVFGDPPPGRSALDRKREASP